MVRPAPATMVKSITEEIRELREMTVPELRTRYREVFGEETRSHHKQQLFRKIAWRIQALEEGGLDEHSIRGIASRSSTTRDAHGQDDGVLGRATGLPVR